jgi:perosamine synthetase
VFVDVDPATWCIDPEALEDSITPRTRGIIPVHLYGHPADMDAINHVAAIHGLWVVEDAAEAHLARYKGRPVGSLARLATFSFYGNKIITSGEGGAVVVSEPQLELRLRTLRGQGMDPARQYYFPVTGYNFRLTNVAAAILCAQLERADGIIERRRQIFESYRELLEDIPGVSFQPVAEWAEPAPWLFCLTVEEHDFGRSRDDLVRTLASEGIETRPFFIPLHTLPPFREAARARKDLLPSSEALARTGLNLPTHTGLTDGQLEQIALAIRHAARPRTPSR